MDDFMFPARSVANAILQRDYIQRDLDGGLGLLRNPTLGSESPPKKLVHLLGL